VVWRPIDEDVVLCSMTGYVLRVAASTNAIEPFATPPGDRQHFAGLTNRE